MQHYMIDIETLGNGPEAAVVSIGACRFDPIEGTVEGKGQPGTFYARADLSKSTHPGVIDPSTVEWWLQQSDDARRALLLEPRYELGVCLGMFEKWVKADGLKHRERAIWSNGPTFDEIIMRAAFERYRAAGVRWPFSYRSSRCCRTIFDMTRTAGFDMDEFRTPPTDLVGHHALDDALRQAHGVVKMYELLGIPTAAR